MNINALLNLLMVLTYRIVGLICCLLLFGFFSKGCSSDKELFDEAVQEEIQENIDQDENESVTGDEDEVTNEELEDTSNEDEFPGLVDRYNAVVKAFPSALGHGRNATGGRGGRVIYVDNLNDSGPGSLRAALEAEGKRYIVVRVAGFVDLQSNIEVKHANSTFEGNTAPGDGIVVRGGQIGIASSNHIIRNLSIMVGENGGSNNDALQIFGRETSLIRDIILDHCSFSHASDENLGISAANMVTVSNTILSNHKGNGGSLIGADYETLNISIVQNLQIWNDERNPRLQRFGKVEFINNMFYGFRTPAQLSYGCQFDMIGNIWENETNSQERYTIDMLNEGGLLNTTTAHIRDNLYNWSTDFGIDTDLSGRLSNTRILPSEIEPMAANLVREYILENVGSRNKSTNGLNTYDISLLDDIKNMVSLNYDMLPYNYPVLNQSEPYVDSDNDGMDDVWEVRNFGTLEQNQTTDFNDNGYTDLEEFFFTLNQE